MKEYFSNKTLEENFEEKFFFVNDIQYKEHLFEHYKYTILIWKLIKEGALTTSIKGRNCNPMLVRDYLIHISGIIEFLLFFVLFRIINDSGSKKIKDKLKESMTINVSTKLNITSVTIDLLNYLLKNLKKNIRILQ